MRKERKVLATGMLLTWWAVISVIVGGVIRIKYVTPEYENTFIMASSVYALGWFLSVIVSCAVAADNDK